MAARDDAENFVASLRDAAAELAHGTIVAACELPAANVGENKLDDGWDCRNQGA